MNSYHPVVRIYLDFSGTLTRDNIDPKITEDALIFLKKMIAINAEIHIVSNTDKETVDLALQATALNAEQLKKIKVHETNSLSKGVIVESLEAGSPAKYTFICDDYEETLQQMQNAVNKINKNRTTTLSFSYPYGHFDWDKIDQNIHQKIQEASVQGYFFRFFKYFFPSNMSLDEKKSPDYDTLRLS